MRGNFFEKYLKYFNIDPFRFPNKPQGYKTLLYLNFVNLFLFNKRGAIFGPFVKPANWLSTYAWKKFIKYNHFHFGEFVKSGKSSGLDTFERLAIRKLASLYRAESKAVSGMILSGASEGNAYAISLGKAFFENQQIRNILILKTAITHDSIDKSAYLMEIPTTNVGLDKNYGISIELLTKMVLRLAKGKQLGILLPLTLGYKITGTSDDYLKVLKLVNLLSKKYKQLKFYIWFDAAFEGLTRPITDKFLPFDSKYVQAVVLDAHKLFFAPYPSGVILFRKNLIFNNERLSAGFAESRSSLPGLALWAAIQSLGKEGIKKIVNDSQSVRSYFADKVKKCGLVLEAISPPHSLSLMLIVNKNKFPYLLALQQNFPISCNKMIVKNLSKNPICFVKIYFFSDFNKYQADLLLKKFESVDNEKE